MSRRSSKVADPFYMCPEWKSARDKALKRDAFVCGHCGVRCLGRKRNAPSPQVDHIEPRSKRPDLELVVSNLQTLCRECHSKKTRAEQLNRPAIGEDGYPVEESNDCS